jgi:DNA modification methylase
MRKPNRRIRGGDSFRNHLKTKSRKRRGDLAEIATSGNGRSRNDLLPKLELVNRDPRSLGIPDRNVRAADPAQIRAVSHSISVSGFVNPALIDPGGKLIHGVVSVLAAIELGLPTVPCIIASHLNDQEQRIVRLALNRLGERGGWSLPELKAELIELIDADIAIEDTGFTIAEFDQITLDDEVEPLEKGTLAPDAKAKAIARRGDVFRVEGGHRLICGDATDPEIYAALMQGENARFVFTDEPYNVPIAGHVTKGDHREFAMASGEMTEEQFLVFNRAWIEAALPHLCDGGLLGTFIDWRGYPTAQAAAVDAGLTTMNLIVWAKTNAGLGSLYRSQHELFALYKKGAASHINNIQLGKAGRWRSNVWTYPGASSVSSDSRKGLEFHPTVKPEAMCADAILDLTNRSEIVLDPFLGSGSTLIAAQRTGRRCFGIELDPLYVDVAIRRYREIFGQSVVLESTGETFEDLARRRQAEQQAG